MTSFFRAADVTSPPDYHYIVLHQALMSDIGKVAVMSGHAAGESCVYGPASPNTHVVVLKARKSEEMVEAAAELTARGIACVLIPEPAPPYHNGIVALGVAPTQDRAAVRSVLDRFELFR